MDYRKMLRAVIDASFEAEGGCWAPDDMVEGETDAWGERPFDADLTTEEREAIRSMVYEAGEEFSARCRRRDDLTRSGEVKSV